MVSKHLPPLRPNAPKKPDKPRYREQFGIVLICPDEASQIRLYEALLLFGGPIKLRVVTT